MPLWVADTDFRAAPAILEALSARELGAVLQAGIQGYSLPDRIAERMQRLRR